MNATKPEPVPIDATTPFIRWMIRADLSEVLRIEREQFPNPWTQDEVIEALRQRNVIGMVVDMSYSPPNKDRSFAVATQDIGGFMLYELHKTKFCLLDFAVDGWRERHGIGRMMAAKLIGKLSESRRNRIVVDVREGNLDAQLFFKAMGFRAINVLRSHYRDSEEDAIRFVYRLQ